MGGDGQGVSRWRERVLLSPVGRQLTGRTLKARLIRGTGGTFVLRSGNTALKFLTSFVLARWLGADNYGAYNFAIVWITLLIVPSISGLDRLLIRDMAAYQARSAWGMMRGLLDLVPRWTLRLSLGLALAAAGLAWLTYELTGRPAMLKADQADIAELALFTLLLGLVLLPLRTKLLVQQSTMQGLRHVVFGQLPEQVVQPLLFFVLVAVLYAVGKGHASPLLAMALTVGTTIVALGVSASLMNRAVPPNVKAAVPAFETRLWLAAALPFAVSRGLLTLSSQIDSLLLGAMSGTEAVALFTVSLRGTQLVSILLTSVNVALAPNIAHLFAQDDRRNLQRVLTQGARFSMVGALPITVLFILFGGAFLGLYGQDFVPAETTLVYLSLGQLVNAITGPATLLMMMTGFERPTTAIIGLSIVLNVVLDVLLIPSMGIDGAAIGSGVSLAVRNVTIAWLAWRWHGLHTTALWPLPRLRW